MEFGIDLIPRKIITNLSCGKPIKKEKKNNNNRGSENPRKNIF